jgi:hypothetical protein
MTIEWTSLLGRTILEIGVLWVHQCLIMAISFLVIMDIKYFGITLIHPQIPSLGQRLEMIQTVKASSKNVIASYYNLDMAETGKLVLRWCSEVIYRKSGTKG